MTRQTRRNLWLAITLALLAGMCHGCGSLDAAYVSADRANYQATAAYHAKLKQLSPADAESLDRLDRRRLDRITAAEKNLGMTTQPSQ